MKNVPYVQLVPISFSSNRDITYVVSSLLESELQRWINLFCTVEHPETAHSLLIHTLCSNSLLGGTCSAATGGRSK